jgi:hypothetical protein
LALAEDELPYPYPVLALALALAEDELPYPYPVLALFSLKKAAIEAAFALFEAPLKKVPIEPALPFALELLEDPVFTNPPPIFITAIFMPPVFMPPAGIIGVGIIGVGIIGVGIIGCGIIGP